MSSRRKESFRHLIIRNYFFLVIVPFIAAICGIFIIYRWNFQKTFGTSTMELLQSELNQLDSTSGSLVEDSMFLYYEEKIEKLNGEELSDDESNELKKIMEQQVKQHKDLFGMLLVYGNQAISAGTNYYNLREAVACYQDQLSDKGGQPVFLTTLYLLPKNNSGYKMILGRALNTSTNKSIAYLYLVVDIRAVENALTDQDDGEGVTYLTDASGQTLYSSQYDEIGSTISLTGLGVQGRSGYHGTTVNGQDCLVVYCLSYKTNWVLIRIIPIAKILKGFFSVKIFLVFLAGIYLLFLWWMLRYLDQRLLGPMAELSDHMDTFAGGSLMVRANPDEPGEIGHLNRHFNDMTERIRELMAENERESAEKNNFKMKALTAQLSPHFIYNALNTIKWMAVINRQDNIRDLTDALNKLLMNASKSGEDYYTVQDEIDMINSYVVIQKARFMNFSLDWDVSDSAKKLKIRRFMIQPAVENSIVHGFGRGRMHGGRVHVAIWNDENLHITVRDNGCGFDVDSWRKSAAEEKSGEHIGIAMINLEQIIAAEYREPYYIRIESRIGEGTQVEYMLPALTSDMDRKSYEIDGKNQS
ncbi:MAG: histidine kinase [Oribacterium sp.]|nr:histidine kinase [Oribacterium sp.]